MVSTIYAVGWIIKYNVIDDKTTLFSRIIKIV